MRRLLSASLAFLAVLFVVAQIVPYRVHNPPTTQGPTWDSPRTEALARRACFDCHSNESVVPWYGYIAPVAWLVRYHVDEARGAMNLSEMDLPQEEAHEAGEEVEEGHMPPGYYLTLHPGARLTEEERSALAAGLDATLGGE
ncbi:MAG TPA: cytochrome C [Deltaproteobacteria bacterium]|nr:cytochrome C [Deltaproteobacteria bacterium]